jgi:outer membrane murein-binding lipoprotein Lpp
MNFENEMRTFGALALSVLVLASCSRNSAFDDVATAEQLESWKGSASLDPDEIARISRNIAKVTENFKLNHRLSGVPMSEGVNSLVSEGFECETRSNSQATQAAYVGCVRTGVMDANSCETQTVVFTPDVEPANIQNLDLSKFRIRNYMFYCMPLEKR